MQTNYPVQLSHVLYTALAAIFVIGIVSLTLGRSYWRNFLAFGAGFVFLLVLHAIGIREAAWAMAAIGLIVVVGLVSSAMS